MKCWQAALLSGATTVAAWCWTRPLLDCHGNPEMLAFYRRHAATFILVPATCCCDDQGQEYDCSYNLEVLPTAFLADIPDPGDGAEVCSPLDPVGSPELLPDPPLGGLTAWPWPTALAQPVVAYDAAGNGSNQPCP